ncbi:hypothetical protein ERJ75_001194700 [Trypanosoma vivax]|nr:hypothetical protein ERJ75_001194700 [Trypanosoma vivax]
MGAVPEAKRPNTSKEGALVQFWSAVADLHSNRYSSVLERRVVHCFVQLASDHAHPAHIWDVLKRTGLLLVVVRALASKEKLRVLISNDGNFCDYMRSIQLVAEASPHNCLGLLLSPREVTKPLFTSFVRIIGELPLLDCEAPVYRLCCDSYVRTVSLLLSDARNCALLVSEQLSPIGVLFHMMNELITDRQDVALTILWVALQILLHTSNYTSHWVKEFDDLSDSTDWLFTVMDHCKAVRDSIYFFKGGRTIALDILCMLLSLSCSTGGQSETLYLHLKAAYNGIGCAEQHRQADAFVLGTRGVKIAVAAALLAMDHHDALFSFLAWILVRTVEANIDIVIAHCLVDESLVIILQQLVHSYEDNSVHGEPPISTIVRLCVAVHASPSIYAAHKAGAARLCLLLTELTSSSKEQIWVLTVQTMMDFRAISNVELLFTGLFAAELLERLNEKLATLCDQNGHNLMLEFMTEISMRVPSLRNKFLLVVNTLLNLIRSGARTDPQLLRRYIDLFTAICVNASAEVRHVYSDLQDRLTCGSFHDVDSIVSGCWILQTCARVVNESCGARTYFTVHSHGLLSCLERLCLNMRSTFEARQMSRSTSRGGECARVSCPSVVEEVGNEMLLSDDGTTEEARMDSQIYSSQCRFFTIKLHLLCILHSNCSETSARAISSGLMYAVSKGPFLDCPVFTSVVARTFIGLCSVSSRAVFETLPGECQGNATDGSLLERDLHFDMMLQDSYGDGLFYRGIQRIVHAGSLGDLYTVIRGSAKNAPRALFATSIVELVLNVYSKRVENLYTLAESGVLRMLAELLAIVVAEDQKHLPHCREKIIGAIKMLGKYGVDHSSVLFSLALCLDTHADGSVSYDPESTVALLRLWKALLNQSSPSSEPVSFCALSASSPCSTQPGACIGDHSMERLGLTTGMDLPVDYRLQKQDRGVSCVSWLLLEENHRPTTEACDVVLLSLWMDNYDNALQLLVGGDGVLRLQLAVAVSKSQQQLVVPISPPAPGTRIPMGQWCMISVACSTSTSGAATRTSRNSLAVRISLQFGSTRVEVPWVQVVPADIKSPTLAAHGADLLRMVNKISVSTSQDNHAGIQPRFLMGALAFFGDVLTAVEERLLFSMGSDNLLSLSMLDKVFITDLSLTLELLGATNGEMLTSDFPHLTLLRLIRAPPNQDRCWRVNSAAFSPYQNSKKLALVAGGFRGALRVMSNRGCTAACTNSPKRQTTVPASDRFSSSDSLRNVSVDSTSTSIRSTPTSAALKDTGNAQGEVLAAVNKPQFFHVSPLYSILDALGGVSFFLWLAVLQAPRSAAFYEAWECFCLVLQRHTLWGFSSTVPRFGEQHLCTLLRGMLGTRIPVCEKVASSFCEVVGRRSILRPDLLGLLLDFTLWSEDAGAFRVVLHHLRDYLLDDHYSCFNRKVLEHCASGWCDRKRRSALDEFLLHLYVHFQHSTTGEWGSATLSYGTAYLGALCRTVSDMKTILQAVKVFVVIEKDPVASAVKWATELLGIVHCMARQLDCLHVKGSASLGDDVVVLFKCPDESVRRAALHVLPYVPLTKKQEDAIVNAYLRRSDTFPSGRILSSEEFDTMVELALEAAHSEDSAMGRILLHLLIVLCAHLSETEHTRVVALLTEVVSRRWPFTGGSLPFTEPKDRISVHVQQSLLGLLPGLSLKEPSFMNSLLELLKHMSAGMVEASWETCGASCGYLVGETALAILLSNPSVLKYFEEKSGLDANVESTLCNTYHYIAHVLRVFDTLLSKGSCTKSFLEDYVSFLKATATTIILLSQCETEFKGKEESNFECDTLSTRTLMHMYLTVFGKPLTFGGNRVSLRLFLLFSEASQRLLIHLQTGDLLLPLTRYFTRVPEDLLKLQWRVVFSLLYSADKTDDTLVKEVMLLHLTGTGYSILGLSLPLQQKRMPCVEPPAGSNWKHIRLQPGSLILEMLRVTDGTAFGDSAPWILILKAASHLLSSVGQESQNRLDMAINVCRLVRYSGSIWSLVKSYVSPSSVQGWRKLL